MIVTVTFNPALDYFVTLDHLAISKTNRTVREKLIAGGKGINVSLMLSRLGVCSTALGFVAGFTGEELVSQLQKEKIHTDFIHCHNGMTRINVKICADEETEINARGPQITEQELNQLKEKTDRLGKEDILILSGTVPSSVPYDFVLDLLDTASKNQVSLIVDSDGPLLRDCLKYHPLLIKPNEAELDHLIGNRSLTVEEAVRDIREQGARNILLSMGKKGSLFFTEQGPVYRQLPLEGTTISSVGAGDSMVAGYVAAKVRGLDDRQCHQLASACGSATAFSDGIAEGHRVQELFSTVQILEEKSSGNSGKTQSC